jgi:hypothetical protein
MIDACANLFGELAMIVPCVGTPEYSAWRKKVASAVVARVVEQAPERPRELVYREVPKAVSVEEIIAAYRKSFDTDPPPELLKPREKRITLEHIIKEVSIKHSVTRNAILSPRRQRSLVLARQEVMWRAREETALSFPQIGKALDRDHTTCLWGARQHQARIEAESAK